MPRPHWTIPAMHALLVVISIALNFYMWMIILSAILSWLVAFNVVNTRNPFVAAVGDFLYRITEPALRPIRSFLPSLGGIDISPLILILIIIFIQQLIADYGPYAP
jgi:YggT family protein